MMTLPEPTAVATPLLSMVATVVSALSHVSWFVMSCGFPKLYRPIATNFLVAGGDKLNVSVGLFGVRVTAVKLAPPPVPISPFFPPQPPRAIIAQVIVNRIEVDRIERLTIQGSCKRGETPALKLTFLCFKALQTKMLQTRHSKLDATFPTRTPRQAEFLLSLRELSSPGP